MPQKTVSGSKLTKRGRMALPPNAARKPLALVATVKPVEVSLHFKVGITGDLVLYSGNTYKGDAWTQDDFIMACGIPL